MIEIIQTVLLIILVDREFLLRKRYKIGIDCNKPSQSVRGWFAIWILCKQSQGDYYRRVGGKMLIGFWYGKIKS